MHTVLPVVSPDPVVFAAGDIASCDNSFDSATAQLVTDPKATVLALGDTVYESGSPKEYRDCYAPAWGTLLSQTHPTIGNHEYSTKNAAGYFSYFGSRAGEAGKGWYSFNIGSWHLIALNSNCSRIGGCDENSEEMQWLRNDLAANTKTCTIAYFHHPVFSSGMHGQTKAMLPIWRELAQHNVDLVLSGHDHDYERFAPQNADSVFDPAGTREFVVGTGGKSHYPIFKQQPNSETYNTATFGLLKLTLHANSYDWQFVPIAGSTFSDSGTGQCH